LVAWIVAGKLADGAGDDVGDGVDAVTALDDEQPLRVAAGSTVATTATNQIRVLTLHLLSVEELAPVDRRRFAF
jgi:hypothetical protein